LSSAYHILAFASCERYPGSAVAHPVFGCPGGSPQHPAVCICWHLYPSIWLWYFKFDLAIFLLLACPLGLVQKNAYLMPEIASLAKNRHNL